MRKPSAPRPRPYILAVLLLLGAIALLLPTATATFVAVGNGDAHPYSADGVTWNPFTPARASTLTGITYGDGVWVASDGGGIMWTSPGAPWVWEYHLATGLSSPLNAVAHGTHQFTAAGGFAGGIPTAGGTTATSAEGTVWARSNVGDTRIALNGIAYGGGRWIAVGTSGTIYVSPDGISWNPLTPGSGTTLNGVAYNSCSWVAVGENGAILTSPDVDPGNGLPTATNGLVWTATASGTTRILHGVAYGQGKWVAVGNAGTILTSTGAPLWTWVARTSGTTKDLYSVATDGTRWAAVGDAGKILTSPDGISWASANSWTTSPLRGVSSDLPLQNCTPNPSPIADFTVDPAPCGAPQTLTFHDRSSAVATGAVLTQSEWTWGDGTAPQTFSPWAATVTHTYYATGTMQVTLKVTDSNGNTGSTTKPVTLEPCAVASFHMDPYPCAPPRTVTFHDTSTANPAHAIVASQWNWGDGSPVATFNPQVLTVTHTYTISGPIVARLRVQDNSTGWSAWVDHALSQCPTISAYADTYGCPDYPIHFAETTENPDGFAVSWSWIFGDGSASDARNPVHSYRAAGTYSVTLKVTDNRGVEAGSTSLVTAHGWESCPLDPNSPKSKDGADGTPKDARDISNSSADPDKDGVASRSDNCDAVPNPDQLDGDRDGMGDVCDADKDGDGVLNNTDNCPALANPAQRDTDQDGIGDACQGDADGDSIPDGIDNCPLASNPLQADLDQDLRGDACDPDIDGDGVANAADGFPLDGKMAAAAKAVPAVSLVQAVSRQWPWLAGTAALAGLALAAFFLVRRSRDAGN